MLKLWSARPKVRRVEAQVESAIHLLRREAAEVGGTTEGLGNDGRGSKRSRVVWDRQTFTSWFLDADELEVRHLFVANRTLHVFLTNDVQCTGKAGGAEGVGAWLQDSETGRVRRQADRAVGRRSTGSGRGVDFAQNGCGIPKERVRGWELNRGAERPVLLRGGWMSLRVGTLGE
jgi:hypothetical protein